MRHLPYQLTLLLVCTMLIVGPLPHNSIRAQNPTPAGRQLTPVAITGATIHVGDGTVMENATLLVNDGKIAGVGTDLTVPAGYESIDGNGKDIYPGLIGLNSQLGLVEIDAVRATSDQREVGTFNPNARALIAFNTDSQIIPTVRSRGVLMVQSTPEGSLVSGRSSIMQLDGWNFEDAAVRGDDGVHINWPNRSSYNWQTGDLKPNEDYENEVRELESFIEQAIGYCGKKEGEGNRLLKLEGLCEALSGNARAYLHADEARDIQAGVLLMKRMGAKPVIVGGYQAYLVADFLKREGVPVILGSTQALPAAQDEPIDQPYRNPALLAEAGVDFAISHEGTWQQRNLPFVAGQAVGFGLDKEKAIMAITLTPARIIGIDKDYGSIAEGKSATFVIVDGDLLDMRASVVERAYIDGRDINLDNKQAELYRKFEEKYRRESGK